MQEIEVYSDGACSGNPGPGGWGAVVICHRPPAERELSGAQPDTTNNRMELTAIIEALAILNRPCKVKVNTDSTYVADAFRQRWLEKWQKNGWRTAAKTPVKNDDLWRRLAELVAGHQVEWHWLRGHAGHPLNERADRLAVAAREGLAAARGR